MSALSARPSRVAVAVCGVLYFSTSFATEESVEFDVESLKSQGLDPRLATSFPSAPRFLAGSAAVTLSVNGSNRGRVDVQFNDDGKPCINSALIKVAGIKKPPGWQEQDSCFDLKTVWPQTEWNLIPSENRIELIVPQQELNTESSASGNWHHGGVAGLVNYDAQYSGSTGASAGQEFIQLGTEAGFNAAGWIFRSRQTYNRFNGVNAFQHETAYAQRTFAEFKSVMQLGQIGLGNSMFGAGQVIGLQVFPEQALQSSKRGPGLVDGIAESQSVVEVRQSGVLVYSTTVPAGPFRLQGFPLLNSRTDLEVTMTSSNGSKREFIVPASALLLNGGAVAPGLSWGVGKLDQQGSGEAPLMATLATGWVPMPGTSLNGGVFASDPWRALATSLETQLWNQSMLTLQLTGAQDNRHNNRGMQANATLSQQVSASISGSITASRKSMGYRELNDALAPQKQNAENGRSRTRDQLGLGLGWTQQHLGILAVAWARSSTFQGDAMTYMRASWSKSFGGSYVGITLEKNSGNRFSSGETRGYLSVSVPLGKGQSVSGYIDNSKSGSRGGLRYNNRTHADYGWNLSADRDFRTRRDSASVGMDFTTPVSQLGGNVSSNSDNFTSYAARANGALVVHSGGITPSANRVGDTFGIAKVGNDSGVRVDTPGGAAWTDWRGYAVIPSVSSFQKSSVQVDTRSLAKNVDIANGWGETAAARGSVSYLNFDVVRTRRVLATVTDTQGEGLPSGASVFDEQGEFITVVGEQGSVFIPDAESAGKMDVQSSGKTLCSFSLSLPQKPQKPQQAELFENAQATCH